MISIHAPSRGRRNLEHWIYIYRNFNPCPLTGATDREWSLKPKKRFQSTPPHGGDDGDIVFIKQQPISIHAPSRGRQIFPGRNAHSGNFNPRPLTGATRHGPGSHGPCSDFNPRPLTGATSPHRNASGCPVFQSTPPHGGDLQKFLMEEDAQYFNPRPLTGATRTAFWKHRRSGFQSTPPHGGDNKSTVPTTDPSRFQSTPPHGGDAAHP